MKWLVSALLLLVCGCQVKSPPPPNDLPVTVSDERAVRMYKLMAPCVAVVEAQVDANWVKAGTAFGMKLNGKDVVVTAAHVVEGGMKHRLIYRDGSIHEVKSKKVARGFDGAILEVDSPPKALELAKTDPEIGEDVYSVGNPLDQTRMLTVGVVENYMPDGHLIAGAALAYGNSGGPLCNEKGEVVGLAVRIRPGWSQFNMFVPASRLKDL